MLLHQKIVKRKTRVTLFIGLILIAQSVSTWADSLPKSNQYIPPTLPELNNIALSDAIELQEIDVDHIHREQISLKDNFQQRSLASEDAQKQEFTLEYWPFEAAQD